MNTIKAALQKRTEFLVMGVAALVYGLALIIDAITMIVGTVSLGEIMFTRLSKPALHLLVRVHIGHKDKQ